MTASTKEVPTGWQDHTLPHRIAHAEIFSGFPADEPFRRSPPSVAQTAVFAAIKLAGGPWDPISQTQNAHAMMRATQTAKAAGEVCIVRDVSYVRTSDNDKQMSDIYFPREMRSKLPLVVHFHGGGWVHGDRANEMFGAPALARSLAAEGCVVVTPSYRLGTLGFMEDAQRAVLWAVANAATLGADPSRLYLSGHSAGGNIAALLAVGPWLAPPVLPAGAVKGLLGISGVYTLRNPLGGALSCYKNHIFDRYMRKRVFGDHLAILAQYSPSALVRLGAGEATPFRSRWPDALSKLVHRTFSWIAITAPPGVDELKEEHQAAQQLKDITLAKQLPPVLLLSASWDLGLEEDAAFFARELAQHTGIKPAHHTIPNTNHASLSWDEATFRVCRDFIEACEAC